MGWFPDILDYLDNELLASSMRRPRVFELHPERIAGVRADWKGSNARIVVDPPLNAGPLVTKDLYEQRDLIGLHVQTEEGSGPFLLYARGTWPGGSRGSGDRDPDVLGGLRRPLEVQQRPPANPSRLLIIK